MTTKLLFGKCNAYPVDLNIRNKVIDFIYTKLEDLYKYSYNILNNISKLKYLKNNEHYVSPNYKGLNYLIIFTIINNIKYCIAIDRKKLSYIKENINIKLLNIYILNVNENEINNAIYTNTIFDGKIINNSIFIIQDCYYLNGNNMLNINLIDKITQLKDILNNQFKNNVLNLDFKINKLYNYNNLKELISNLSKLPNPTNGLIFFPKLSGVNIIFIENYISKNNELNKIHIIKNNNSNLNSTNIDSTKELNTNIEIVNDNEINNIIYNYTNFLKSRHYSYENNKNIKILSLSKTDIIDVYNVFDDDNIKLGIALIPNLKISHMCNSIIKTSENVKFKCTFSDKFKKWIPLSAINN